MWRFYLVMLGGVVALFSAQGVHFVPLSIEELAAEAQLVAQGTVLRRACQEDAQGRLYTRVELQVKEVWKGRWDQPILTVVQGGGVLGEKRVQVSGQAEFVVGEEVVVFVVFNGRGEAVTIGLRQGKFQVRRPSGKSELQVSNGFAHGAGGAGGAGLTGRTTAAEGGAAAARVWLPLGELKQRVQKGEVRP